MLRALLILACAASAWAAGKPAEKEPAAPAEDGKRLTERDVKPGSVTPSKPLIEFRRVAVHNARLKEGDKPCTVVTGYLVSNLQHVNFEVTVHIEVRDKGGSQLGRSVKISTEVKRPVPAKETKFVAVGPPWCLPKEDGQPDPRSEARYTITYDVRTAGPRTLDEDW